MLGRFGRHSLTAAQQMAHLRASKLFPGEGVIRGQGLTWRCDVRPFPLSRKYTVRVTWSDEDGPEVFVDDPDLVLLAGGARLPHVYDQRPTRLCLYLPGVGEFRRNDRLDLTVLPWAVLWLAYYEDWLARGCQDWQGGGEHPDGREDRSRALRRAMDRHQRLQHRQGCGRRG